MNNQKLKLKKIIIQKEIKNNLNQLLNFNIIY